MNEMMTGQYGILKVQKTLNFASGGPRAREGELLAEDTQLVVG